MVVKFVTEVVKAGAKKFGSKVVQKKTAKELMATNEKSLQRVISKGGYDVQKPEIRSFLHKHRKQTTKKILKQNKPK